MAYNNKPPDLFDLEQPVIINADIADPLGVSNALWFPSYKADWIAQNLCDSWPWDLAPAGNNHPTFNQGGQLVNGPETLQPFTPSGNALPMTYEGATLKTEDAPSQEWIMPKGKSETRLLYNCRSDHQSDTSAHILPVNKPKGRYPERLSTSTLGGSTAALATTEEQFPTPSRKLSNSSLSSTSSASLSLTSQQINLSDRSCPATAEERTAKDRKMTSHNAVEKRYREHMKAKFRDIEIAISGRIPSNQPVSYPQKSMCSAGDKSRRRQQSKSKILTNALTYIHELEADNIRLKDELSGLGDKL